MSFCACGRSTNGDELLCERCTALVVFGLTRDATPAEIKDAYRVLAKVWHPDRFQGDERMRLTAEEKLKEINSAYQLLTTSAADEPRRKAPESPPPAEEPHRTATSYGGPAPGTRRVDFHSWFRPKRRFSTKWIGPAVVVLLLGGGVLYFRHENSTMWDRATSLLGDTFGGHSLSDILPSTSRPGNATPVARTPTGGTAANPSSAPSPNAAARPRSKPAAEGASLLVYPADDPGVAYFTIGSTKSDVLRVQGKPSKVTGDVFAYGPSQVYFRDGRVESWHSDPSAPLRARMPE